MAPSGPHFVLFVLIKLKLINHTGVSEKWSKRLEKDSHKIDINGQIRRVIFMGVLFFFLFFSVFFSDQIAGLIIHCLP